MKKKSVILMAPVLALSMAACSSSTAAATAAASATPEVYMSDTAAADIKLADTKNLTEYTSYQIQQLDYTVTALAEDHEYNANFVDGLLENDKYGNLAPCLATSYSISEDGLTYTFHLRDGVKWVTNTGEEYATLKADDFVTGLRHAAENNSGTAWLVQGIIKGFSAYMANGDFSDAAWANVGVKAVDDMTVQYSLEVPTPYFASMTTYAILYPINREFLESQGDGCKLGSPDLTACKFGTTDASSILYNGDMILQSYDLDSSIVMAKNANYWDAEHVYLDSVTRIYDDGSDPYSAIRSFEQSVYAYAPISAQWENFDQYMTKYDGYTHYTLPNSSVFGMVFNFNRQIWDHTNYANDDATRADTHTAIMNANFRRAIRAAWDTKSYLMVSMPEALAQSSLRNINNFPNVVRTSDGTSYGDLVTAAYDARTGTNVDLADGQDPWYGKESALAYIEAAKAEGVKFPVHLDMMVNETSKRLTEQGQSLKKSVEENTDGQIIIELVMTDQDTIRKVCYYNQDPSQSDYDISTFTGWSPDYADPKSFVDIYSPVTGYYMVSMGLTNSTMTADAVQEGAPVFGSDDDIKMAAGLYDYEELYKKADAITNDLDARYKAFAEADAQLIDTCFYIPTNMQTRSVQVSHVVPFTRVYSVTGLTEYKYKGMKLQDSIVTTADYDKAYADFEKGGTAADLQVKE